MCRVRRSAGILKRDRKFQFFFFSFSFLWLVKAFYTHTHTEYQLSFPLLFLALSVTVWRSPTSLVLFFHYLSLFITIPHRRRRLRSAYIIRSTTRCSASPGNAHTHAVPGGYLISGWFQIASLNREKRMTEDEEKKNSGRPSFLFHFLAADFFFFPHLVYLDAAASV